jgi:hypothetical protein
MGVGGGQRGDEAAGEGAPRGAHPIEPHRPARIERASAPSITSPTNTRDESVAERQLVLRARAGLAVMCVLWPATIPADFAYASLLGVDATWAILATRGLATLVFLAMFLRFRGLPSMSARELRLHRHGLIEVSLLALGFEASFLGGLDSEVAVGAIVIGAALGVFPRRWRDHLPIATTATLLYPGIVIAGALLGAPSRTDLVDPLAIFRFAVRVTMIGLSVALGVVMSHLAWSLRRGSFEKKRIGPYELRRPIGRGGMGEVWAARHVGLGREVAVKLLDVVDEIARERFEREVRATSALSHPNTIRVFDFGATDDGALYYVMELLEGEHLGALAARDDGLPAERVVYLVEQAARALAEAHDKGIVHRDVKPENLFVCSVGGEEDTVKVLDFGIARDLVEPGASLTKTGAVAGSAVTVAPEVVAGKAATPAADVYALGAVLYFALTGCFPFEHDQRSATLLAHLSEPLVPPSLRSRRAIPPELEAVVLRCLARSPAERFVDGRAVALALAQTGLAARHVPSRVDETGSSARPVPTTTESQSRATRADRLGSGPTY